MFQKLIKFFQKLFRGLGNNDFLSTSIPPTEVDEHMVSDGSDLLADLGSIETIFFKTN